MKEYTEKEVCTDLTVQDKSEKLIERVNKEFVEIVYSPLSDYNTDEFVATVHKAYKITICRQVQYLFAEQFEFDENVEWLDRLLSINGRLLDFIYDEWCEDDRLSDLSALLTDIILKI